MFDPLQAAMKTASYALSAQSTRMRVVSENLANAESTGKAPGADPYQRKTVNFESVMDDALGIDVVQVGRVSADKAPFRTEYDPGHVAADAKGMVKLPNVDMMVELADMREAMRSYSANTLIIKQAREMVSMTVDLLRAG
ncbi:MAG: flagellar basal body rod protein FlgC [Hyphomicrobium sp.]|nr:flagellar basal body rod protein FlgC [Hyphomicrobium sp.]